MMLRRPRASLRRTQRARPEPLHAVPSLGRPPSELQRAASRGPGPTRAAFCRGGLNGRQRTTDPGGRVPKYVTPVTRAIGRKSCAEHAGDGRKPKEKTQTQKGAKGLSWSYHGVVQTTAGPQAVSQDRPGRPPGTGSLPHTARGSQDSCGRRQQPLHSGQRRGGRGARLACTHRPRTLRAGHTVRSGVPWPQQSPARPESRTRGQTVQTRAHGEAPPGKFQTHSGSDPQPGAGRWVPASGAGGHSGRGPRGQDAPRGSITSAKA